jgi:hypothetical protein
VGYVRQFWLESRTDGLLGRIDKDVPGNFPFSGVGIPVTSTIDFAPKELNKMDEIKSVQTDIFIIALEVIKN